MSRALVHHKPAQGHWRSRPRQRTKPVIHEAERIPARSAPGQIHLHRTTIHYHRTQHITHRPDDGDLVLGVVLGAVAAFLLLGD